MANISIEQFEKEALAFLESNAERRPVEKAFVWGEGSDNFYREKDRDQEAINAEEGKLWRQKSSMLASDGSPDPRHMADVNFLLHTTVYTTNLKQHSVCPTRACLPSALAW